MEREIERKDELYIKNLLQKAFVDVDCYKRFEFSPMRFDAVCDFVTLDDKDFTYFEIKSEFDKLDDRFDRQYKSHFGLFSKMYLVIPKSKMDYIIDKKLHYDVGVYLIEDLERGIIKPYISANRSAISLNTVRYMLWQDDVDELNSRFDIAIEMQRVTKKWRQEHRDILFQLFYSNVDCLKILNEFIPRRFPVDGHFN